MKYGNTVFIVAMLTLFLGCESKEEIERAKRAEAFKQEQLQKEEQKREALIEENRQNQERIKAQEAKKHNQEQQQEYLKQKEQELQQALNVTTQKEAELLEARLEAKTKLKELQDAKEKIDEQNSSVMQTLGFSFDSGKIIIDTNKAKEFFGILQKDLTQVDNNLHEVNSSLMRAAGIEVNNTKESLHLNIDLNKTDEFLENFAKKVDKFSQELEGFTLFFMQDESNNTRNGN